MKVRGNCGPNRNSPPKLKDRVKKMVHLIVAGDEQANNDLRAVAHTMNEKHKAQRRAYWKAQMKLCA